MDSVTPLKSLVSPCIYQTMKVSESVDSATATWKDDKLNVFLLFEEVELIKAIRLSKHNKCDQYIWPYTTNLEYTVKSGYWTVTHDFVEEKL